MLRNKPRKLHPVLELLLCWREPKPPANKGLQLHLTYLRRRTYIVVCRGGGTTFHRLSNCRGAFVIVVIERKGDELLEADWPIGRFVFSLSFHQLTFSVSLRQWVTGGNCKLRKTGFHQSRQIARALFSVRWLASIDDEQQRMMAAGSSRRSSRR